MEFFGGKLYIGCDFKEEFPFTYTYGSAYEIDVATGNPSQIRYIPSNPALNSIDTTGYHLSEAGKVQKKIRINADCELEYTDDSGKVRPSTKTPEQKNREEVEACISFSVLPDAKRVAFFVFQGFGDYGHGPIYLVNLDGSKQTKIIEDIMFDASIFKMDGSEKVYGHISDGYTSDLFYVDANFSKRMLRPKCTKIQLCEEPSWRFF